jgi:hypothetical protein
MMTFRPPAVFVLLTVRAVVRRKREAQPGLPLPPHLLPEAVWADPDGWRQGRFAWAKQYQWPPGKIGYLPFFMETLSLHQQAKGGPPPSI